MPYLPFKFGSIFRSIRNYNKSDCIILWISNYIQFLDSFLCNYFSFFQRNELYLGDIFKVCCMVLKSLFLYSEETQFSSVIYFQCFHQNHPRGCHFYFPWTNQINVITTVGKRTSILKFMEYFNLKIIYLDMFLVTVSF